MKTPFAALLLAVAATLPALAAPPTPEQRQAMKEKWDSMTPEQQEAAKERMRKKWESMTPEQREAAKKRFAERNPGAAARLADKAASAPAK
jgi:hypothetical protein